MAFITDDFLLQTATARHLYRKYAASAPIVDFHCHLSASDIAENRRFRNLTEIWLDGDHYKWRAMRADGVAEKYCSGDAEPYEKFVAWARTVPRALRNPLYHWTHLELIRHFGIHDLLDESTAGEIWHRANELLSGEELSTQGILKRFDVLVLCTTEDPTDSLQYHDRISGCHNGTHVLPTFRPDAALRTGDPVLFNQWTDKLGISADMEISRLADFREALQKRHDYFHEHRCRISDHGLDHCYAEECGDREATGIFRKIRSGKGLTAEESAKFASSMMLFFGQLDAQKGWVKQLHLGAQRNTNTRALKTMGADAGFDSIGDWRQGAALISYIDRLDRENSLPKMILFNVNPSDNYLFATLTGNYPQEGIRSKIQYGSSWWFLDQKEGIEWQVNAISYCGLLSNFVGMVTDSRSFMSFPRHEYFRRILCNLLGIEIEAGLLPENEEIIGRTIRGICLDNAQQYLDLPVNARDRRQGLPTAKSR